MSSTELEIQEYLEHVQPDPNDFKANYDAACVQKIGNFASSNTQYLFEYQGKDRKHLTWEIVKYVSPKLFELIREIKRQDAEDMRVHGRKFKHFVFSNVKSGTHGAKIVATALIDLLGMQMGYEYAKGGTKLLTEAELNKNKGNNVYLLSSVAVYKKPLSVPMRKEILRRFNSRPDNVHGDLARIIVMDAGFKEGIDLFDIKYVHIFEPQATMADQKQVIGRGTRTCGQKGLEFHPTQGWPLHVNIYDLVFPEEMRFKFRDAATVHQLYLKSLGIDLRIMNLMADMERVYIEGAIDADLNRPIHEFGISANRVSKLTGGDKDAQKNAIDSIHLAGVASLMLPYDSNESRKIINKMFSDMKWEKPEMKNLCGGDPTSVLGENVDLTDAQSYFSTGGGGQNLCGGGQNLCGGGQKLEGGSPSVMTLNPTQNFISHYFTPGLNRKGMLLSHSVGTGKTCTAIATATREFEQAGYTILWVTRTTLKNDIWKNMFDQICSVSIANAVKAGTVKQSQLTGDERMKLLSKSWFIKPMSYKQFTNLVSKSNDFYKQLVKKNGEQDPLRKTLLIIDEAHKLYGESDLGGAERPNVKALYEAIMRSYELSGPDSVRLLLMTATPMTSSPMELVQLLNLCRARTAAIPDDFAMFAATYLDATGKFTADGETRFKNEIAGHISYLNRERDARMFSQPIIREIAVPILNEEPLYEGYDAQIIREINANRLEALKSEIDDAAAVASGITDVVTQATKDFNEICIDTKRKDSEVDSSACKKIAKSGIASLKKKLTAEKKDINSKLKTMRGEYNTIKKSVTQKIKNLRQIVKSNKLNAIIQPSTELFSSSQKSSIRSNSSELYTGSLLSSKHLSKSSVLSPKSSIRSNSSTLYTGSLLGGGEEKDKYNSPINNNDYQKYIQSVFYNLKTKCKRAPSRNIFTHNPHILELIEKIEAYKKEIAELKKHMMETDRNKSAYIKELQKQINKAENTLDDLQNKLDNYVGEMDQNKTNAKMRINILERELKQTVKNKDKYELLLEKAYKKSQKNKTEKNKKDRKEFMKMVTKANELQYNVGKLAKDAHANVRKIVEEEQDAVKTKIDLL